MRVPLDKANKAVLLHNFDEWGYLYIRVIQAANVRFGSSDKSLQANPNDGIPINNATPVQPFPWKGPVFAIADAPCDIAYETPGAFGPDGYRRGGR